MLGIQLGALSVPELRRLLESARTRGQTVLVSRLEAELAARPGRAVLSPPLRMSHLPPPPPARSPPATRFAPVRRRRGPAVAVASAAAVAGAVVAWGITFQVPGPPQSRPVTLAASSEAPRIAVALTNVALPEEAAVQPEAEPAAPALEPETEVAAAAPPPAPVAKPGSRNPCYDLPTARERLICGYPSVAIQDQRMKAALDRARAYSRDPNALDAGQAAWQSASANVSDRLALMDRYAQRIAQLEDEAR